MNSENDLEISPTFKKERSFKRQGSTRKTSVRESSVSINIKIETSKNFLKKLEENISYEKSQNILRSSKFRNKTNNDHLDPFNLSYTRKSFTDEIHNKNRSRNCNSKNDTIMYKSNT